MTTIIEVRLCDMSEVEDDACHLVEPIAIAPFYASRLESIEPVGGDNLMLVWSMKSRDVFGRNERVVQAKQILPAELIPSVSAALIQALKSGDSIVLPEPGSLSH